jgi:hypothetical protein
MASFSHAAQQLLDILMTVYKASIWTYNTNQAGINSFENKEINQMTHYNASFGGGFYEFRRIVRKSPQFDSSSALQSPH